MDVAEILGVGVIVDGFVPRPQRPITITITSTTTATSTLTWRERVHV